jgi:hypothetical protein
MPQEKHDSGHAIVPVAHPNGEIHAIAVPPEIVSSPEGLADLHSALGDAAYHHEPTRETAIEFSPQFRKSAATAMTKMQMGEARRFFDQGSELTGEAGFEVRGDGTMGPLEYRQDDPKDGKGGLTQKIASTDLGALHTHDKFHEAEPSSGDREAAKNAHATIWVASRNGLYSVDPAGQVTQVFKKSNWATTKEKPE